MIGASATSFRSHRRHDEATVDGTTKGMPVDAPEMPVRSIAERGWNILSGDVSFPVAVLRREALRHNAEWMKRHCEDLGINIAPHGKTPLCPEIFQRQMADGAFAITVADTRQARIALDAGINRIILANQVVAHRDMAFLAARLAQTPEATCFLVVDSPAAVQVLETAFRSTPGARTFEVLVEGGVSGGRCGCRSLDDASAVLSRIEASGQAIALRGVEGYEGVIPATDPDAEAKVAAFVDYLGEIAVLADRRGLLSGEPAILSAGGTKFHDIVVERFRHVRLSIDSEIVIRSGCYLFHDHGIYAAAARAMKARSEAVRRLNDLQPAIEVWAEVLSRPEPELAIINAGRRDCPFDAGFPTVLRYVPDRHPPGSPPRTLESHTVVAMHDQHGFVRLPAHSPLQVGDRVGLGISHPCTLFDKWRLILEVDDSYTVVGAFQTRF